MDIFGVIILQTTEGTEERCFQKWYLPPDLWVSRWVNVEAGRSPKRLLDWSKQDNGGLDKAGGHGYSERYKGLK